MSEPLPRLRGLPPVLSPHTKLLILGSFPGRASLAAGQYYAHPRNQFWSILGALWSLEGYASWPYARRLAELQGRGLGLWDVYASCRREGSLDANIEDAELNPLAELSHLAPALQAVAHNGGESARVMRITRTLGLAVHRLPSTSPANASWSFERKRAAWHEVFLGHGLA